MKYSNKKRNTRRNAIRKRKNIQKLIVLIVIIVITLILTIFFFFLRKNTEKENVNKVEDHQKIIENKSSEDIDPIDATEMYHKFIDNTLLPQFNEANGGRISLNYTPTSAPGNVDTGIANYEKPPEALGIVSEYIDDLNNDNIPELIIVRVAQEAPDSALYTNFAYIHIYTMKNGKITELAQHSRTMRYGILQLTDSGNFHLFIKEENGQKYLCVLNCMRSPMSQFHYIFYMDIFQMEEANLVCRKSVTSNYTYIYDTTNIPVHEDYAKQQSEREIIFEEPNQSISYANSIHEMKQQFDIYFDLGDSFISELTHDAARQFGYEENNENLLPYDFTYSGILPQTTELFRLRSEWLPNESVQYWEYFSDVNENLKSADITAVQETNSVDESTENEGIPTADESNLAEETPQTVSNESLSEGNENSMSAEQIEQMIVNHYNAPGAEANGGNYTILSHETTENETQYAFILRFQLSNEKAQEIIDMGGMPSAYRLVGTVTVNKTDGTVVGDFPGYQDIWNLWTE